MRWTCRYKFPATLAIIFLLLWVATVMSGVIGTTRDFNVGDTCIKVKVDNVRIREPVFLHAFFNDKPEGGMRVDIPKLELVVNPFTTLFAPTQYGALEIEKRDPSSKIENRLPLDLPEDRLDHVTHQAHTEVGVFVAGNSVKPTFNIEVDNWTLQIVPAGTGTGTLPDDCVLAPNGDFPREGTLSHGEMELTGAPRDGGSLNRHYNDPLDQAEYYKQIDPAVLRLSLDAFKKINGFLDDKGKIHESVVSAFYFNAGDLGFGRSMHVRKRKNGDIAYYVHNFSRVEDAIVSWKKERDGMEPDPNPTATVAMEYSPINPDAPECSPTRLSTCKRVTKFYAFDANGGRVGVGVDLDGRANVAGRGVIRSVPGMCTVCHGGKRFTRTTPEADLEARFIPFDTEAFGFIDKHGFRRRDQEKDFKRLNFRILETNPAPAVAELICGWYWDKSGAPPQTCEPEDLGKRQNRAFVPVGWAGHEVLYSDVVKRSCRTCHLQRPPLVGSVELDFNTFAEFENVKAFIRGNTCRASTPVGGKVQLQNPTMPHARWTFLNFWLNPSPRLNTITDQVGLYSQSAVLAKELGFDLYCSTQSEFVGLKGDMNADNILDETDKMLFLERVKEYQDAFDTTAVTTYPHPLDLNHDGMITNADARVYD